MPNELVRALRLEHPETIPVCVSVLPAMWIQQGAEFQRVADEYPQFFGGRKQDLSDIANIVRGRYKEGTHVDEWGCVWTNVHEGMDAIVTGHPVKSPEDVFTLEIPKNRDGSLPHGFMYLRLLDLCGFENAMMLFAEEGEALRVLLEKVLQYNIYQVEAAVDKFGDIAGFGDDLGMQKGLAIGAECWRKYLKPCFATLYGIVKKRRPGLPVYMHTDGCIYEIMQDLVECGVDMINPQFRANGLENLVRVCRTEQIISINLDLDRQLFPFATRSQIFDHVAECVESLYLPEGALALNIELNYDVPLENCAAILDAAEKYRHYKG